METMSSPVSIYTHKESNKNKHSPSYDSRRVESKMATTTDELVDALTIQVFNTVQIQ